MKIERGQSLIEILVAVTVAAVVFVPLVTLIIVAQRAAVGARNMTYAQSLIQDMSSAVRSLASQDWHSLWGSSGLVAYWSMDEGAGTTLFEPVNGNNGTLTNGPTWTNGKAGGALSFDGVNDYVDIANSNPITINSANWTLAAWIKTTTVSQRPILSNRSTGSGASIYFGVTSGKAFLYQNECVSAGLTGIKSINDNVFHHYVFVREGSSGKIYVDGALDNSATQTSCATSSSRPWRIGHDVANGTEYFPGLIDEVRIYNRALSATEISAMYNGVSKLYPQNIGGLWSLKEGQDQISSGATTFLRGFTIGAVQRDTNGNIVSSGGTDDPSTKKVTYTVEIRPAGAASGNIVSASEYVTRSQSNVFLQTDWSGGAGESSPVTLGTNKFWTSSGVMASSTGQFRLKLTTE